MRRFLTGTNLLAALAVGTTASWFTAYGLGAKPDDGILAFGSTMWMIWATHRLDRRRRNGSGKKGGG